MIESQKKTSFPRSKLTAQKDDNNDNNDDNNRKMYYFVLDRVRFPNGTAFFNAKLPQHLNFIPFIVHNNCIIGNYFFHFYIFLLFMKIIIIHKIFRT